MRLSFDAPKGVLQGRYFNFTPAPPEEDVLPAPLRMTKLPLRHLPREGMGSRLWRRLARYHIGRQSATTRLRWKAHDTIAAVMAAVTPGAPGGQQPAGGLLPTLSQLRHPHQLKPALDLLLQLPRELSAEAKYLELLLALILRQYAETMVATTRLPFSFEHEARALFARAFKMERQIKGIKAREERFAALQHTYDDYYHGRFYYIYGLLRRERLDEDSKLFSFYCRAATFMARLEWNGEILDKPNPRLLPQQHELLFLAQRDNAVVKQLHSDRDFANQFRTTVRAFPA